MNSSKSHKLKIVALGAINGIIFGTSLEIVLRSLFLYEKYLRDKKPSTGFQINYSPYPFSWWFLPFSPFVFVTLATFIVRRYFAQYIKSTIWFWQIVGVIAVFGFAVYSTLFNFYYCYFNEELDVMLIDSFMQTLQADLFMLLIAFPIVAAFNLLFALVSKWRKLNLP